jgi:hypothetical protein
MTKAHTPRCDDSSSIVIHDAVTILAARHGSNRNLACAMLRSATNDDRSLEDLARAVVTAAGTPSSSQTQRRRLVRA